jgi:hypothetical protein
MTLAWNWEEHLSEQPGCDFCGRSEAELSVQVADGSATLEMDADGLWICRDCRARLVLPPVGETAAMELDEELLPLVGKSAGAICFTLNLPYEPPYQSVIDAASKIAYDEDRFAHV